MKYCAYNNKGIITGFYDDEINEIIPEPNLEISDVMWLDLIQNQGLRQIDTINKTIISLEIPDIKPIISPNWQGLTQALRGTPLFGKIYAASKSRLDVNVTFTLMSSTLNSSNPNIEDLRFAFHEAKNTMGDLLTPEDIAGLNAVLAENGFDITL